MTPSPLYRSLVDIPAGGSRGDCLPAEESALRPGTAVSLTPQSIAAFPVAASVVTVVWKVLAAVLLAASALGIDVTLDS